MTRTTPVRCRGTTPYEAALGAKVQTPTLDGKVELAVPPGSNGGRVLRLRGKGLPQTESKPAGDLYVTLKIMLPEEPDAEFLRRAGFSDEEIELAVTIARQLAFAIDRKRNDEALRKSEERFRAIVETTPECVMLVAPDGTLLHMNSSGLRMVGADCAERKGCHVPGAQRRFLPGQPPSRGGHGHGQALDA